MTDCDRLLAVLQDGKLHSHSELYGLGMIVHSRVADLRARGHNIICRRERNWDQTKRRETVSYFYCLVGSLDAAGDLPETSSSSPAASSETLDEYGVDRAAAEVNEEFPGMLLEDGVAVSQPVSRDEALAEIRRAQLAIWGEAA